MEKQQPQPIDIDRILTRQTDAPITSVNDLFCELPSCDLVRVSRLESHRCNALGNNNNTPWPLLITSTPRSATVYMTTALQQHGMKIQDDWSHKDPLAGRVSWIHAFDDTDQATFGESKAYGKRYKRVLHQTKEPLSGISSMCTEPILTSEGLSSRVFLQSHIPLRSSYFNHSTTDIKEAHTQSCLEFWVEWHTYITAMRFPTFEVFDVNLKDIFTVSEMNYLYQEKLPGIRIKTNSRKHRKRFTWQDLYTINPYYTLKAWELAHYYGYRYPEVDFNNLTCLEKMPLCDPSGQNSSRPSNMCLPGHHYHDDNASSTRSIGPPSSNLGFQGWTDSGCVEVQLSNRSYVGVRGLISEHEMEYIKNDLDPVLMAKLKPTVFASNASTILQYINYLSSILKKDKPFKLNTTVQVLASDSSSAIQYNELIIDQSFMMAMGFLVAILYFFFGRQRTRDPPQSLSVQVKKRRRRMKQKGME